MSGRGVKGGPKFLFNFLAFQTILENWPKNFVPNIDKDPQTLLDALLSNFFTVFYGFTMEDKGKKGQSIASYSKKVAHYHYQYIAKK